jgi:cytidine deaminase
VNASETYDSALVDVAARYRERAWAPISNYKVGAALLGDDGKVYGGCNVEHIILGLSCCAERVAIQSAVAEGVRGFSAVAVFTASSPPAAPCGVCRQMLHTWGVQRVIMANTTGEREVASMAELLPRAFDLKGPLPPV